VLTISDQEIFVKAKYLEKLDPNFSKEICKVVADELLEGTEIPHRKGFQIFP
jgi:hypothetical protein